ASLIAATRHYGEELMGEEGRSAYHIKNAIIILVTDGFQAAHPDDKNHQYRNMSVEAAAQFAKEHDVRVYVINVDPSFATEEFAPHRRLMERITTLTGGKFYLMDQW